MLTGRMTLVTVLTLVATAAMLLGVASASSAGDKLSSKKADIKLFSHERIDSLHEGMSAEEVKALFGLPSISYDATLGTETDRPWHGVVWKYRLDKDTSFHFVTRLRTNTFVFFKDGDVPKLNHWKLEATYEKKK